MDAWQARIDVDGRYRHRVKHRRITPTLGSARIAQISFTVRSVSICAILVRQMPNLRFKRLGIYIACILAAVGLALFVLKLERPPAGFIDVRYVGMSESVVFFDVDNKSTQTIYIQGKGADTWPDFAITECKTFDYSAGTSDGNVIIDGPPSSIKLSPGARLHLEVTSTLPRQYKGGHCRSRLSLLGGTFVESEEFTPR